MDFSLARSERIVAIFSTVVAVAILAGGVTAYQSHHAPVDDVVQLESDLRFQLEVAFRHDPNERARRLVKLVKVSKAWQQSSRTEDDHETLAKWLLEATIRSMPGTIELLPPVPRFESLSQQTTTGQTPDVRVELLVVEENVMENPEPVSAVPTLASRPDTFVAKVAPQPVVTSVESLALPQPEIVAVRAVEVPIRINLTELAARIAGYHEGLDEIETSLLTLEAEDFTALAKQVRLLEEMTRDFRFVKLYYEALTGQERRAIAVPRSMTATLSEIERRIDRTQAALSGDFLGEFDANNQNRIGALRQLLAEISIRVEQ